MKVVKLLLLFGLLSATVTARPHAKPTLGLIASILHDLVHDPSKPLDHNRTPPHIIGQHPTYMQPSYYPPPVSGHYAVPAPYPNVYPTHPPQYHYQQRQYY